MGSVHDIAWDTGQDPASSMPSLLLIKFDEYTGPEFPSCPQGIVPVFAVTRQFDFKGVVCSRTQFPLRLAYAITVQKKSGFNTSKGWVKFKLQGALSRSFLRSGITG